MLMEITDEQFLQVEWFRRQSKRTAVKQQQHIEHREHKRCLFVLQDQRSELDRRSDDPVIRYRSSRKRNRSIQQCDRSSRKSDRSSRKSGGSSQQCKHSSFVSCILEQLHVE